MELPLTPIPFGPALEHNQTFVAVIEEDFISTLSSKEQTYFNLTREYVNQECTVQLFRDDIIVPENQESWLQVCYDISTNPQVNHDDVYVAYAEQVLNENVTADEILTNCALIFACIDAQNKIADFHLTYLVVHGTPIDTSDFPAENTCDVYEEESLISEDNEICDDSGIENDDVCEMD